MDQTLVEVDYIVICLDDFFTLDVLMVYTQGHPVERDVPGSFDKQLVFAPCL